MMACRMSSGWWTLPPACPTKRTMRFAGRGAFHFAHHLSQVQFGHHEWPSPCAAISAICFSGKGQAVISRNLPTFTPFSRAISMARCATREVMP